MCALFSTIGRLGLQLVLWCVLLLEWVWLLPLLLLLLRLLPLSLLLDRFKVGKVRVERILRRLRHVEWSRDRNLAWRRCCNSGWQEDHKLPSLWIEVALEEKRPSIRADGLHAVLRKLYRRREGRERASPEALSRTRGNRGQHLAPSELSWQWHHLHRHQLPWNHLPWNHLPRHHRPRRHLTPAHLIEWRHAPTHLIRHHRRLATSHLSGKRLARHGPSHGLARDGLPGYRTARRGRLARPGLGSKSKPLRILHVGLLELPESEETARNLPVLLRFAKGSRELRASAPWCKRTTTAAGTRDTAASLAPADGRRRDEIGRECPRRPLIGKLPLWGKLPLSRGELSWSGRKLCLRRGARRRCVDRTPRRARVQRHLTRR